jgi:hypothetical protein
VKSESVFFTNAAELKSGGGVAAAPDDYIPLLITALEHHYAYTVAGS